MTERSRSWRDGRTRAGLLILAIISLVALTAPWISPASPTTPGNVVATRFLSPGTTDVYGVFHLLGTDRLGRDVWARLASGARISLSVGILTMALSLVIGGIVGGIAGLSRGGLSTVLLGLTDFALGVPRVILLLLLAALWQPGAAMVIVVLGVTGWMPIARLVFAETRAQLSRPYAEGAAALGSRRTRLFLRHVVPHAASPILAAVTLGVGNAISLEAGLSFLGLGVQPPASSWGTLIASGRDTVVNAPWVGLAPGIALVLVVVGCTLVADGIAERQLSAD